MKQLMLLLKNFLDWSQRVLPFLVVDSSEQKKVRDVNKNFVATTIHIEYKNVLLNNKCLKHWINRIQNKNHTIGT